MPPFSIRQPPGSDGSAPPQEAAEAPTAIEVIRDGEALFRKVLEGSPVAVYENDTELRYTWIGNPLLGLRTEDILGKRDDEFLPADQVARHVAHKRRVLETGRGERQQHSVVLEGRTHMFDVTVEPERDGAGEIVGVLVAATDITPIYEAEQALRDSEERFRSMANTAPAMLWVTDSHHETTFVSRAWLDYTGQTPEEASGFGWADAIHPDDRELAKGAYLQAAKEQRSFAVDFRLGTVQGAYRWVHNAGRPQFSADGKFVGFIGAVSDIHERKRAEEALREADRRKDEFLAMLGHELRNPLAAIRSAAELVKLAIRDDPRLRRAHGVLERQSSHMARLIDGLLEVSRIARGKIELDHTVVDLRRILDDVVEDRMRQMEGLPLCIERELPPVPVWVRGDAVRLVQVVDNLLSEADRNLS